MNIDFCVKMGTNLTERNMSVWQCQVNPAKCPRLLRAPACNILMITPHLSMYPLHMTVRSTDTVLNSGQRHHGL